MLAKYVTCPAMTLLGLYKEKWLHNNNNNWKKKTIFTAAPVSEKDLLRKVSALFSFYKALKLLWIMFGPHISSSPHVLFVSFISGFSLFPYSFLGIHLIHLRLFKRFYLLNWQNFSNFKCLHQDFFNWKFENIFFVI